jgi:hypothetical protein
MLFWVVYAIAFHLVGVMFVMSLVGYLRSPHGKAAGKRPRPEHVDLDLEVMPLFAQFVVAPKLAVDEVRTLLRSAGFDPGNESNFGVLISYLEELSAHSVVPRGR